MRCCGFALRFIAVGGVFVSALAGGLTVARAQDDQRAQDQRTRLPNTRITVETVAIEAGRLVVEGRTPSPRIAVTLDGQFTTTADGERNFRFSLLYLPA